jgi:hypothetical protein
MGVGIVGLDGQRQPYDENRGCDDELGGHVTLPAPAARALDRSAEGPREKPRQKPMS